MDCERLVAHLHFLSTYVGNTARTKNDMQIVYSRSPMLTPTSSAILQQTRGAKRMTFRPNAWKRKQKHGLEKRLSTPAGRAVLWRRVLRGRHSLHT